jgi:hypothetical protein
MPDPFHYPPLTPDELTEIRLPVSRDDLLSLARQIPAWRRAEAPERDDDGWIAAAGKGLGGLRVLLGWALGARGHTEIIRNATSWTIRDHGAKPKDNASVTWTDGTCPRLRFDAERCDPTVARCPDETTSLHAAAREVARRPNL